MHAAIEGIVGSGVLCSIRAGAISGESNHRRNKGKRPA
jgi:hypothetical protein